jgi:hypothetical protein
MFGPTHDGSTDETYKEGISVADRMKLLRELGIISGVCDMEKCISSWKTCVGVAANLVLPRKE